MEKRAVWTALALALVFAAPAAAQTVPTVQVAANAQYGNILTDNEGRVVYRYTRDEPNTSNCYDQCAQNWPPLTISSGEPLLPAALGGSLGTTTRRDGSQQVTYNGMPLYYFARDSAPGDTNGQGVANVWYVVEAVMP